MGKKVANEVLDAALDHIINNANEIVACEGEPADFNDANTVKGSGGVQLGSATVGTADFTKADGDVSGRKVTVAQKDVSITDGGTADHVALIDTNNNVLLHVTTMSTNEAVSNGDTLPLDSYDEEIEDPT